jgi:Electron transfer DM13
MNVSVRQAPHLPSAPLWLRLLAIPLTLVVLLAGLWVFAGVVAPGYYTSIAFGAGWFVLAYAAIRVCLRRGSGFKLPVQATFAATALAVGAVFAWTTFRDVTVNEQIVRGAPASAAQDAGAAPSAGAVELARGEFTPLAHAASGTAAIVDLADGSRVLTFENLEVDNGPDLRVYLVAGKVSGDGDVDDFIDVRSLKGNKGNQQYTLRDDIDVERYSTVVIWCRAFSVGFAKAELEAS